MFCEQCGAKMEPKDDHGIQRDFCSHCGHIVYRNPYPCVSVLVVDEAGEKVLMGVRKRDSVTPGKWCLPCGYIEYDETYGEAAVREVKEETGIDIAVKGIVNVVSNRLEQHLNTIVIAMLAKPLSFEIQCKDDLTDAKWVAKDEIAALDLAFQADAYLLDLWESGRWNLISLEGAAFDETID